MSWFNRSGSGDEDDNESNIPHQEAFIAWSDDFDGFDTRALALLTPEQRAAQQVARWTLYHYADAMWDAAKAAGVNPAVKQEYNALAAFRDLAMHLASNADDAQSNAGEEERDSRCEDPKFPPMNQW